MHAVYVFTFIQDKVKFHNGKSDEIHRTPTPPTPQTAPTTPLAVVVVARPLPRQQSASAAARAMPPVSVNNCLRTCIRRRGRVVTLLWRGDGLVGMSSASREGSLRSGGMGTPGVISRVSEWMMLCQWNQVMMDLWIWLLLLVLLTF